MKPTFKVSPAPVPASPASSPDEQEPSIRLARAIVSMVFLPRILPTSVNPAEACGSAVSPDDQRHDPFLVLRPGNQFSDRTTAAHDHGPIRNLHNVIHRVRHDDDREPFGSQPQDEVEDMTRLTYAQGSRGLVE